MADLLLVDNDPRLAELLGFWLQRSGHAVRTAESYRVARVLLAERVPDLVLADLELGAERGEEELPALAREGLLPPTLVVSGYLDPELEARLANVPGVLGTVAKPFDLEDLRARIEAHLAALALAARARASEPPGSAPAPGPGGAEEEDARLDGEEDEGWIEILPADIEPVGLEDRRPAGRSGPEQGRCSEFPDHDA